MLTGFVIFFKSVQDYLEMFLVAQEIGIGRIYKKGFDTMLPDVTGIGFLQPEQIIIGYGLFIRPVSLPDIFLQLLYGCVQIDQEVGLYQLLENNIV